MRRLVIALLILSATYAARASGEGVTALEASVPAESVTAEVNADPEVSDWGFGGGLGLAWTFKRQINPDFADQSTAAQFFATARYRHFSLLIEYVSEPERKATSGGLSIASETSALGVWGRYALNLPPSWQPFLSLGYVQMSDSVRTTYLGHSDQRQGQRRALGLGLGVSQRLWRFVLGEIEGRINSTEASRRYGLGLLFRVGVEF